MNEKEKLIGKNIVYSALQFQEMQRVCIQAILGYAPLIDVYNLLCDEQVRLLGALRVIGDTSETRSLYDLEGFDENNGKEPYKSSATAEHFLTMRDDGVISNHSCKLLYLSNNKSGREAGIIK